LGDKLEVQRVERPGQSGQSPRKGEKDKPADVRVVAQKLHPLLIFAHEKHRLPHGRLREVPAEHDGRTDDQEGHVIEVRQAGHFDRREAQVEIGPRDAEAVVTACDFVPLGRHGVK